MIERAIRVTNPYQKYKINNIVYISYIDKKK
jgi:hypothetical protein